MGHCPGLPHGSIGPAGFASAHFQPSEASERFQLPCFLLDELHELPAGWWTLSCTACSLVAEVALGSGAVAIDLGRLAPGALPLCYVLSSRSVPSHLRLLRHLQVIPHWVIGRGQAGRWKPLQNPVGLCPAVSTEPFAGTERAEQVGTEVPGPSPGPPICCHLSSVLFSLWGNTCPSSTPERSRSGGAARRNGWPGDPQGSQG